MKKALSGGLLGLLIGGVMLFQCLLTGAIAGGATHLTGRWGLGVAASIVVGYGRGYVVKRLISVFILVLLTSCAPGLTPTQVPESTLPASPSPVATPAVSATLTQLPAVTATTGQPAACPNVTEGTQLLSNEEMGYCLLYPDGYIRVDPLPYEVCLVPEGPAMACHSAAAFFEVSDAEGRSTGQVADQTIAEAEASAPGISIQRASLAVGGEEAVVLDGLPGVTSSRNVLVVHNDRLYVLIFLLPDAGDAPAVERSEQLYKTVIDSFTFLPAAAQFFTAENMIIHRWARRVRFKGRDPILHANGVSTGGDFQQSPKYGIVNRVLPTAGRQVVCTLPCGPAQGLRRPQGPDSGSFSALP